MGFDRDGLDFLQRLAENNNRPWFAEHKDQYEALVLHPALDFIAAMQPRLHAISDHFDAIPKRVGGSLMRIYRDTRFGKDKTPFKTNIGIQFRHQLGKDVHAPGYYLHIAPDGCFIGVGIWQPPSPALAAIREQIAEHPGRWQDAIGKVGFRRTFELSGASLKRPPRGYQADHAQIEDLKRKDFIALANLDAASVTSKHFAKEVASTFKQGSGFMQFLCQSLQVPF